MDATEVLKKIRALEIKTKGLVQTVFAGDYHSVFKGRGMNFEDVREYQPGDEIRAIDWNVTARLGTAFVKKFTEERELTVVLVVDVSASGNFGSVVQSKRELAAEVACLPRDRPRAGIDQVIVVVFRSRLGHFALLRHQRMQRAGNAARACMCQMRPGGTARALFATPCCGSGVG